MGYLTALLPKSSSLEKPKTVISYVFVMQKNMKSKLPTLNFQTLDLQALRTFWAMNNTVKMHVGN